MEGSPRPTTSSSTKRRQITETGTLPRPYVPNAEPIIPIYERVEEESPKSNRKPTNEEIEDNSFTELKVPKTLEY